MNAKHLSKFSISKKLALFGAVIAIAMIAAFSICATNQANAQDDYFVADEDLQWFFNTTGAIIDFEKQKQIELPSGEINIIESKAGTYLRKLLTQSESVNIHQEYRMSQNGSIENKILFLEFISANNETNHEVTITEIEENNADHWWTLNGKVIEHKGGIITYDKPFPTKLTFNSPNVWSGFNISGHVADADDVWQPVPGAFVQYCQWSPWFWDYVPVPEMSTFTDWFGNYTIEGITEDVLPGVIRVYRFGYEVGESWPIWGAPEGADTIYRFVEMTPAEPPVPPTPPTPPDPPVPPGPVPPEPVPPTPVPPTPVPTPVDPGGGIAQTSDATPFAAVTIIAVLAALGCGVALRKEHL